MTSEIKDTPQEAANNFIAAVEGVKNKHELTLESRESKVLLSVMQGIADGQITTGSHKLGNDLIDFVNTIESLISHKHKNILPTKGVNDTFMKQTEEAVKPLDEALKLVARKGILSDGQDLNVGRHTSRISSR